jgi:hypothetical protein
MYSGYCFFSCLFGRFFFIGEYVRGPAMKEKLDLFYEYHLCHWYITIYHCGSPPVNLHISLDIRYWSSIPSHDLSSHSSNILCDWWKLKTGIVVNDQTNGLSSRSSRGQSSWHYLPPTQCCITKIEHGWFNSLLKNFNGGPVMDILIFRKEK